MASITHKYILNPDIKYEKRLESIGYGFYNDNGLPYWIDHRYYEVTPEFSDRVQNATKQIWELCLEAVQYIIDNNQFHKFGIPNYMIPHIIKSWDNDVPSIYGRFDFGYDSKKDQLKMLEFNADTPTSLFETGVVQWYWKEHYFPNNNSVDQFSYVHERLIEYWGELKPFMKGDVLHFTCVRESLEDLSNIEYLRDTAIQAGYKTNLLYIDEIGWNGSTFVDLQDQPITDIFKLYPWEWMVNEDFGVNIVNDVNECQWIEPSWKMLLSNKAILPILWELNPNHEYLLECYFDSPRNMPSYVKKPLLSREGANVEIYINGFLTDSTDGEYGSEGFVYQQFVDLHTEDTGTIIIGSWVIGQESCGMSFRESFGLITNNSSRYIPHIIKN